MSEPTWTSLTIKGHSSLRIHSFNDDRVIWGQVHTHRQLGHTWYDVFKLTHVGVCLRCFSLVAAKAAVEAAYVAAKHYRNLSTPLMAYPYY